MTGKTFPYKDYGRFAVHPTVGDSAAPSGARNPSGAGLGVQRGAVGIQGFGLSSHGVICAETT